jgi:hypothetical protein
MSLEIEINHTSPDRFTLSDPFHSFREPVDWIDRVATRDFARYSVLKGHGNIGSAAHH